MTGLPAARQTDMTKHGGPITQGSRTVYIGTSGGVACSTCPGGVSVGNPVNPMLGAKVQSGEVDLALPGPLPFVLSRDYSSYQTDTPAPVGLLGPGWWLPVASRTIIWSLVKQMWVRCVPLFHRLHRRLALER